MEELLLLKMLALAWIGDSLEAQAGRGWWRERCCGTSSFPVSSQGPSSGQRAVQGGGGCGCVADGSEGLMVSATDCSPLQGRSSFLDGPRDQILLPDSKQLLSALWSQVVHSPGAAGPTELCTGERLGVLHAEALPNAAA